jgi:hypothetical protein
MKVALCFIISYEHILNKEEIWREWIEPNKDIINVYFYYKDIKKIKSHWIRDHAIPPNYIFETSYFHVIPAYLSVMEFAVTHDKNNSWFCMLTDSCSPIVSPKKFRHLFYTFYDKSIMRWNKPGWNIELHKRANLSKLPKELHLANAPWFILKRENVLQVLHFIKVKQDITKTICSGGLANESLFAIILYLYKQLGSETRTSSVISDVTHIADWYRMSSVTSPYLFKEENERDIKFIDSELERNKYAMFIRKVAPEYPNEILRHYIYEQNKELDDRLVIREPLIFVYNRYKNYLYVSRPYIAFLLFIYFVYYYYYI